MSTQFRMDSVPGSLVVVGGTYEPWLAVLEKVGWRCTQVADLRKADALFVETGPCIGIVDLSHDEFSLNGIANLVSSHKQVRWLAFIREAQLSSDTICQFIVNFCIDFFTAPIPDAQLLSTIGHQLGMLKLEKKVWPHFGSAGNMGLIGESMPMKRLRDQIKRIGPTDVSILIYGESGTGKETVAKAIHKTSSRAQKPFISVNCRAMSEKRLESELFGLGETEEGQQPFLLQADGGTLLLNDILTLPKSQQLNLLRFLQEGTVETRQGVRAVDVRILAANSSDIEKELNDAEDQDARFKAQVEAKESGDDEAMFYDAVRGLTRYHWPGNVRELMNQIKRVVLMSDTVVLDESQLDLPKRSDGRRSLKSIRERSERDALLLVLESHSGQVSTAAKELGVSRATMYRLLNKHNLITDENF
ncbi:cyclic-di-GMP-binding transcriptional regulator VpsR [Vibrio cholerae]